MKKTFLLSMLAYLCLLPVGLVAQVPAFPGADGYGRYTQGGRGGSVYYVTSLDDTDTPGTLRYGVTRLSKVTILFKVSGTIHLNSRLDISQSHITIAGQSAPGDGICVADYPVSVSGNNVIVRYMRFRMGDQKLTADEADGADAFGGRFCQNVIIDHCSISWCTDECASFYANTDFTMQWCIISESLRQSLHSKGAHGYGAIWGGLGASYLHNMLIHHDSRTPRFGTGNLGDPADHVTDMRNNVIYNWSGNGCYGAEGMTVNMINNYYKPGPATTSSSKSHFIGIDDATSSDGTTSIWGKFYLSGNYNPKYTTANANNWNGVAVNQSSLINGKATKADVMSATELGETPLLHQHTVQDAYEAVLNYAGCSRKRDAIDERLVNECRQGTYTYKGASANKGGIIDKLEDLRPSDADATWTPWPELASTTAPMDADGDGMYDTWEELNGLDPTDPADRNLRNGEGYTMLEVYLNSLVSAITEAQYEGSEEVGQPGEPYTSETLTTDTWIHWTLASGKAGETASVSKEGIVASTTYTLGEEMTVTGTRSSYGKTLTKFQPSVEYKAKSETGVISFAVQLAEGVRFRPTELSVSAVRYGTSGGYFDLVWVDGDGKPTTLSTGIHAADKSNDEASMTTQLNLSDVSLPATTGTCQLKVYVYKLNPSKEMGLADIKIGGHVENAASVDTPLRQVGTGDIIYYNLQGQRIVRPKAGQMVIICQPAADGKLKHKKQLYH
ncbi:MAG: hypothetical protein IJA00_09555 [Bacteroidaceae bacterium]|nr:hypothetical protein [Bacteroidaceae bacterium]